MRQLLMLDGVGDSLPIGTSLTLVLRTAPTASPGSARLVAQIVGLATGDSTRRRD